MNRDEKEQKLTRYVLGELPALEAAEMEYAVSADPALRLAVEELDKFQAELGYGLGGDVNKLLPRHKGAIMRAAREAVRDMKVETLRSHKKSKIVYFWPIAAAAMVGLGVFSMTMIGGPNRVKGGKSVASGKGEVSKGDEGKENELVPLDPPIGSLAGISRAVRVEKRMPRADEVNLGELMGSYPIQFKQVVALKSGSVLGVEVVRCPWKPSASLVFASLKGLPNELARISVSYSGVDASVGKVRFLGEGALTERGVERKLNAGEAAVLVMMVEGSKGKLGVLEWNVNGSTAPSVVLERDEEREETADAKFARLICGYALWLKKAESYLDEELVLAMAREAAAGNGAPDRFDFLDLVDRTMKISGE